MASFLKQATDFTKNTAQTGVQGVSNAGNAMVGSLNPLAKKENPQPSVTKEEKKPADVNKIDPPPPSKPVEPTPAAPQPSQSTSPQSQPPVPPSSNSPPPTSEPQAQPTSLFSSLASGVSTGVTTITNPAIAASKASGSLLSSVAHTSVDISSKVAKTGLNVTSNVLIGTADLAGTAVGGVVSLAADTSGKVFQPVASGLKAIEGLEKLGEGLEYVNGLPIKAVQEVGRLTIKAMNMSGFTPTFFDPDADGVVHLEDTIKGLIVLGLEEKTAKYAAYALHSVFSYPTSDTWVPGKEMVGSMPIHIDKIGRTRWGKNWGTYERVEWVRDVDFNTFFEKSSEDASTFEKWKATFTKGRQYFGILLLIFEWGTTWPFVMPPMPADQIPFKEEMGGVVRKLILPTILRNYNNAHPEEASKAEEKDEDHKKSQKSVPPGDVDKVPGGYEDA